MDFMKTYQAQCCERFGYLGFKKLGNTHWRVVNDVIQTFHLQRGRGGLSWCRIQFGITPLCFGFSRNFVWHGCAPNFNHTVFPDCTIWQWQYDSKSEESILECIESLIEYIQTFLITYFERGIDCMSAREENLKLFHSMFEQRCAFLRDNPWQRQYTVSDEEYKKRLSGGEGECYMALKTGAYAIAAEYFSNLVAARSKLNEAEQSEKDKEYIKGWNQLLERALAQDNDFFARYLAANERKSRIALGLEKE